MVRVREHNHWSVSAGLTLFFVSSLAASGRPQSVPAAGSLRKGQTFYLDSRRGDDANPGTSAAKAWKSLAKVNTREFQPGDRILLASGSEWSGQLWPKGSGAEGSPITVDMYGGGVRPVIHGDGRVEDAVLLKNQEYWEIENLEISNRGPASSIRRGVHVAVEDFGEARHVYIRSLTIHDVNGSDDEKANGGIDYTCRGDRKPSRFVDLRIENNQIYRVDRSGIFGWSDRWQRSKWYPSLEVAVRGNVLNDIGRRHRGGGDGRGGG